MDNLKLCTYLSGKLKPYGYYLLTLQSYFTNLFGDHHPTEIIKLIMMLVHEHTIYSVTSAEQKESQEWIDQYFNGCPTFGKKICCNFIRNGSSIDKIMLNIVLPELPQNVFYKKFCIYDLIRQIDLDIGGSTILRFNSKELEMYDKTQRDFELLTNCCVTSDNQILYPIDLDNFFGSSLGKNNQGILLEKLYFHEVRMYIKLGDIKDIIDGEINNNLDLIDIITNCRYCTKTLITNLDHIMQNMYLWDFYHFENFSKHTFKMVGPLYFVIYAETIENLKLTVNYVLIDVKIIRHGNIFELSSDIIVSYANLIQLFTSEKGVNISVMINKEKAGIYHNGMFNLSMQ